MGILEMIKGEEFRWWQAMRGRRRGINGYCCPSSQHGKFQSRGNEKESQESENVGRRSTGALIEQGRSRDSAGPTDRDHIHERRLPTVLEADEREFHLLRPEEALEPLNEGVDELAEEAHSTEVYAHPGNAGD